MILHRKARKTVSRRVLIRALCQVDLGVLCLFFLLVPLASKAISCLAGPLAIILYTMDLNLVVSSPYLSLQLINTLVFDDLEEAFSIIKYLLASISTLIAGCQGAILIELQASI